MDLPGSGCRSGPGATGPRPTDVRRLRGVGTPAQQRQGVVHGLGRAPPLLVAQVQLQSAAEGEVGVAAELSGEVRVDVEVVGEGDDDLTGAARGEVQIGVAGCAVEAVGEHDGELEGVVEAARALPVGVGVHSAVPIPTPSRAVDTGEDAVEGALVVVEPVDVVGEVLATSSATADRSRR